MAQSTLYSLVICPEDVLLSVADYSRILRHWAAIDWLLLVAGKKTISNIIQAHTIASFYNG